MSIATNPPSVIFTESVAGQPAGSQCSGDVNTTECQCGTECLPWKDEGSFCLHTQPLAHLQSCGYSMRTQPCDSGLMCEQGVCVRADKYNLNKWDQTLTNKKQQDLK